MSYGFDPRQVKLDQQMEIGLLVSKDENLKSSLPMNVKRRVLSKACEFFLFMWNLMTGFKRVSNVAVKLV